MKALFKKIKLVSSTLFENKTWYRVKEKHTTGYKALMQSNEFFSLPQEPSVLLASEKLHVSTLVLQKALDSSYW